MVVQGQRNERGHVTNLLQHFRRVLSAFFALAQSSAPINLPWTFSGAMHRNQTLDMLPVELKKVSQRSREIRCGPVTLVRACTCLGRSGKTAVWGKTTKPCAAMDASMAGFSW